MLNLAYCLFDQSGMHGSRAYSPLVEIEIYEWMNSIACGSQGEVGGE